MEPAFTKMIVLSTNDRPAVQCTLYPPTYTDFEFVSVGEPAYGDYYWPLAFSLDKSPARNAPYYKNSENLNENRQCFIYRQLVKIFRIDDPKIFRLPMSELPRLKDRSEGYLLTPTGTLAPFIIVNSRCIATYSGLEITPDNYQGFVVTKLEK